MEDKTPIYILMIVGIVALVAVVYMITHVSGVPSSSVGANTAITGQNTVTGNMIAEEGDIAPIDISGIGRVLFGVMLIGICVYVYAKVE
jgi:hypothetical protein